MVLLMSYRYSSVTLLVPVHSYVLLLPHTYLQPTLPTHTHTSLHDPSSGAVDLDAVEVELDLPERRHGLEDREVE